ncbi:hypothetical protein [Amycolatopsis suaedae]|uniref:Uncharacterized protein n=1 Tax=Amycolatopsis suaedae TaxID=2510978 RepID=A0A4Q7J6P6_9PSEU|nr:hypothetical protein [Amycolatopsis suaedae]RZQ63310.1 hypothetical protein EWH70_12700 [Amycolatopsis suaedae]
MKSRRSWEQALEKHREAVLEHERRNATKLLGWRTRHHRRRVVGVVALGNLIMITAAAIVTEDDTAVWVTFACLWFTGLAVILAGQHVLRILAGRMTAQYLGVLDERERLWRYRVNHIGYQVAVALMIVAFGYIMLIAKSAEAAYRGGLMLMALALLATSVPGMILGWTLPDDDPEDIEELSATVDAAGKSGKEANG